MTFSTLPVRVWRAALLAGLGLGVLAASGCRLMRDDKGLFVDPRDDYLDAKPGAPLVLPERLTALNIEDALPIPDIVEQPVTKVFPDEAPRPTVLVGRDFDAVRIQRLGEAQWIVLGRPPAQVWPMIQQFLAENGVSVGREQTSEGIIESAWLVVVDQNYGDVVRTAIRDGQGKHVEDGGSAVQPGRERLRFRVERGIRRGSTEVHVRHERAIGVGDDPGPAVPQVEDEVVAKLAEYFAAGVSAPVSMVGRDIASAEKAAVVKDERGYPALRLNVAFDRGWATVGQALERAEIDAEADRAEATYQAVFPTAGQRSWMRRIVPGGDSGRDTPVKIRVEREGDATVIHVSAPNGRALAVDLAEEVLLTLREFAG